MGRVKVIQWSHDAEKNKQNNAEKDKLNFPPKKIDLRFEKAAARRKKKTKEYFRSPAVHVCVGGKTLKFFLVDCAPKKQRKKENTEAKILYPQTERQQKHTNPVLNEPKILCENFFVLENFILIKRKVQWIEKKCKNLCMKASRV